MFKIIKNKYFFEISNTRRYRKDRGSSFFGKNERGNAILPEKTNKLKSNSKFNPQENRNKLKNNYSKFSLYFLGADFISKFPPPSPPRAIYFKKVAKSKNHQPSYRKRFVSSNFKEKHLKLELSYRSKIRLYNLQISLLGKKLGE